mmetsp:Transcript_31383/g.82286  ORF Transcript_31383/g.82286 Transcript_31383/m.82286 type:complete len:276 (+) Transcript_31383:1265-2092(+)
MAPGRHGFDCAIGVRTGDGDGVDFWTRTSSASSSMAAAPSSASTLPATVAAVAAASRSGDRGGVTSGGVVAAGRRREVRVFVGVLLPVRNHNSRASCDRTVFGKSAAMSSSARRPCARPLMRCRADRPCPADEAQCRNASSCAAGSRHPVMRSRGAVGPESTSRDCTGSKQSARSPFAAAASKNQRTWPSTRGTTTASNHPAFSTTAGTVTCATRSPSHCPTATTIRDCGLGHIDPANDPSCDAKSTMSVSQSMSVAVAATAAAAVLSPDSRRSS